MRTRYYITAALSAALLSFATPAHTQSNIIGSLSNFDCYDDDGSDACGYEIELDDISDHNISHTYGGSAFGAPSVRTVTIGGHNVTLVHYYSPTARVLAGQKTHFGVSLNGATPSKISYSWLHPAYGGGYYASPVQLPTHTVNKLTVNGKTVLQDQISNNTDPELGPSFYVLPYHTVNPKYVSLENLMVDNSVVLNSVPAGGGADGLTPELLSPGDTWVNDDATEGDPEESGVYWFKIYTDYHTDTTDVQGPQIATILDATLTSNMASIPQIRGTAVLGNYIPTPDKVAIPVDVLQNGAVAFTTNINCDSTGKFTIPMPITGSVYLRIKPKHFLSQVIGPYVIVNSGNIDILPFTLVNGDIDNNNIVNIIDYSYLSEAWGQSASQATWNTPSAMGIAPSDSDIDGNGLVNINDYAILSDNFNKAGQ